MAFKKDYNKEEAAEARKKEMDEITEKLKDGILNVFDSDNYKNYLNFCSKLPHYSVNNQMLIMLQMPEATMCQSFKSWQKMNRHVKRGEKGLRILAPSPYKIKTKEYKRDVYGHKVLRDGQPVTEEVEKTITGFKVVSTFDISQTEGDPVPTICNELDSSVDGYNKMLEAVKETIPVPIEFKNINGGAKGYYSVDQNRIVVQEGMSEAQTLKTLIHEAAHQKLHSKEAMKDENKSRNQKEAEAESVAYVVCQHYGIDTSDYSFTYVASWSNGKELKELRASLELIRKTASDFIDKIDEKLDVEVAGDKGEVA